VRWARRVPLLAAAALLAASPSRADSAFPPSFELIHRELLNIKGLPAILSEKAVGSKLRNGLTTTFAIGVKAHDYIGREANGSAQIDVRYEPWDEVFLVEGRGNDGRRFSESFPSFDRLAAWWQGLKLPALSVRGLSLEGRLRLEVEVGVIPFSRAEQRDTQRWLNRSLRQPETGGSPAAAGGTGVLDLLVATSIKRRSYLRYSWTVELDPRL
jgi:hypothetical protein